MGEEGGAKGTGTSKIRMRLCLAAERTGVRGGAGNAKSICVDRCKRLECVQSAALRLTPPLLLLLLLLLCY